MIQEEVEGDLVEAAIDLLKKIISGKVSVTPIPKGPIPVPSKLPEVDIGPSEPEDRFSDPEGGPGRRQDDP